jgi:MFS family permease
VTGESVTGEPIAAQGSGGAAVLRNRSFLLLWLSQLATQIGSNMVLYALTVVVLEATDLSTAVSGLFLTFLVPSVLFSALAGVYVDRIDRRIVLVTTNVMRALLLVAIFFAGHDLTLVLLINIVFATTTVFFAPAEAAMIPTLVPREQLVAANGLFTLTLNGAFAIGYALLGPLITTIAGGPEPVLAIVAVLFAIAAAFCALLPSDPPVSAPVAAPITPGGRSRPIAAVAEAGQAVGGTFTQLREGISYIREHGAIAWTLVYLGIAASLVGVIGVLGPKFAQQTLGLMPKDLIVVVLPLGIGIVMGVLILNNYGSLIPRRRAIEGGLIMLGVLLGSLTIAGPLSRFLQGVSGDVKVVDLSALTSLIAVVVFLAFLAGIAYGIVAISSQTQLQEDLPEEVRGRVFGVLNMLVSVASILPIIVFGSLADLFGTTAVILAISLAVVLAGVLSIIRRGPLEAGAPAEVGGRVVAGAPVDPASATLHVVVVEEPGHTPREAREPARERDS